MDAIESTVANPNRVVSLLGAATEVIYRLGERILGYFILFGS